jgi:ferredoxin
MFGRIWKGKNIARKLISRGHLPRIAQYSNGNKEYLQSLGYSASEIDGVLKAFPSGVYTSVSELKSLGTAGLNSVVEAVRRDLAAQSNRPRAPVFINIKLPGNGSTLKIEAMEGDTLYDLVQRRHDLSRYLECACKGIAACSTCHVIVDPAFAPLLPEPEESEADMIDLAWGATDTSRLGCQIHLTKKVDGIIVTIPEHTNNLFGK